MEKGSNNFPFGKEATINSLLWKRGVRGDLKEKMLRYNKRLRKLSRLLRENMTEAERLLWEKIREKQLRGSQFYRQKTIGNYIVDSYCSGAKLIIELDGGQHYTSEGEQEIGRGIDI